MQRVAINDIAESVMAFNTNYKDTGLFGVYAVAQVLIFALFSLQFYFIALPIVSIQLCGSMVFVRRACALHYMQT